MDVALHDLPALPRDDEGPVFRAPWEAHAFALAVRLAEAGYFTWPEWAAALSAEIAAAGRGGAADLGDTYYQHWLAALERLCTERGIVADEEMRGRCEDWRLSYLATPHGRAVELRRGIAPSLRRGATP